MILSALYRDALVFAYDLHAEQERKGSGVPYLAHLIGVSSLVMEYGGDEDEAIAGLLHDAVEDQGGSIVLGTITERFGPRVGDIVSGCSDSFEEPKPPWRERKERYLRHLATAPKSVQFVAGCDKLYNARAILNDYRTCGEAVWTRFSGGREGVLWYYGKLSQAFLPGHPVLEELRRVVGQLESMARGSAHEPDDAAR